MAAGAIALVSVLGSIGLVTGCGLSPNIDLPSSRGETSGEDDFNDDVSVPGVGDGDTAIDHENAGGSCSGMGGEGGAPTKTCP